MTISKLLKVLDLSTFIAIDFETTGLSKFGDRIIEVAAILYKDGKPIDQFDTLVNPQMQISDEIIQITGITNKMVSESPTEKEIVNDLQSFLGSHPLVAHNAGFDEGFLTELLHRYQLPELSNTIYDTLHLSRVVLFDQPAYNLGTLAEYFNLSSEGAHRAKKDTENCGEIFIRLVEEAASYPLEIISKCVSILKGRNYYNTSLFINLADALIKNNSIASGLTISKLERNWKQNKFEQQAEDNFVFPTVEKVFAENGTLSDTIPNFEKRDNQIKFIHFIHEVIQSNSGIGVVEAGTGLGKSFGYLYESMKYVYESDEKKPMVISCHTKSLQDQLFFKDLPTIAKAIGASLSAIKLKGRANYICLSRFNWLLKESSGMLNNEEAAHLLPLVFWLHRTQTGDLEECTGFINSRNYRVHKLIQSDQGFCTTPVCNKYEGCFLGSLRKTLFHSDIIVINHALLLSDVLNPGLLPEFDSLIIDEAHNLIDAAYSQFSMTLDSNYLKSKLLICQPKYSGNKRWFNRLKSLLNDQKDLIRILSDLDQIIDLTVKTVDLFFDQLSLEYGDRYSSEAPYVQKYIINDIREEYRILPGELHTIRHQMTLAEKSLSKILELLSNANSNQNEHSDLILSTNQKLDTLQGVVKSLVFLTENQDSGWVYWQEGVFRKFAKDNIRNPEISIHAAPIDPGSLLSETLFTHIPSIILTSATLKVEQSFEYFLNRSGIARSGNVNAKFSTCLSPFLYDEQVKYFQYSGKNSLSDDPQGIAEVIYKCHHRLQKKILVLFTAYRTLSQVTELLKRMEGGRDLPIYSQTQSSSRYGLIQGITQSENGILMGTSSFWEGIDLSGNLLEVLIIAKLPFQVPSDPIVKAYSNTISLSNRNAFMEFTIPECILKYRQGFGRLIRTSYDEGTFIVLDNRIAIKQYGRQFQDAIPVHMNVFSTLDSLIL